VYADLASLFFMYQLCSWYLALRLRFVCPIYALWHILHLNLYILLFSYSALGYVFLFYVLRCRCGGTERYVYIGVIEHIGDCSYFWAMIGESGPDLVFLIRVWSLFCCTRWLSFWSRCCGMLLFFAIVCIAYQPFVFCLDLVEWSAFW